MRNLLHATRDADGNLTDGREAHSGRPAPIPRRSWQACANGYAQIGGRANEDGNHILRRAGAAGIGFDGYRRSSMASWNARGDWC